MGTSRAYLDTYYLLEVVFEGEYKKRAERLLSQISSDSFEVFIPQIVVGEAVSQIYEKCGGRTRPDRLLERFASLMEKYGWGDTNMSPPSNRAFRIAAELSRVDNRLVGVDTEILAIALADPESKFLFTPDQTLTENESICDYELQLRHGGERSARLKISPSL
ncbi:MAG: hypothetical protein OXP12_07835 [Thaumarchaeota archaeon]|nr:hypothetical protein [Nitrososphaerota archaeon]MDE0526490.1 hypothetical protein [Nitrososphaerota archaeon]